MQIEKKAFDKHAIVLGGGFGGLLAGRVLADHFTKVTIIERDPESATGTFLPRKGVPQGLHFHALLYKGVTILYDLFPGIDKALTDNGAYKGDPILDTEYYFAGKLMPRVKTGKLRYMCSRPLLEETIRSFVNKYSNINFLYEHEAQDFLSDSLKKRIIGVRVINKKVNEEFNLYGDLVVDATGRTSSCPDWLQNHDYKKPDKIELNIDLLYMTQYYRGLESFNPDWLLNITMAAPPHKKIGGSMLAIEKDKNGKRWIVTLVGQHGDFPGNTDEEFQEFSRRLLSPAIYEAMQQGMRLSPCMPFKIPYSTRYTYEKSISELPSGFIAIGDAWCCLNPIYAQGMSVCALEAEYLQKLLSDRKANNSDTLHQNYFKGFAKILDGIWKTSSYLDLLYPQTKGKRPLGFGWISWYRGRVMKACLNDPKLWETLMAVNQLEKPSATLFKPGILFRVLLKKQS